MKFSHSALQPDHISVAEKGVDEVLEATKVRTKIIRDKCAYLLNELQIDLNNLGEEQGLNEPPIRHTSNLKRKMAGSFPEELPFFLKENTCWYILQT